MSFHLGIIISQLVLDRFNRLIDNSIVVLGTKDIIPSMVFAKFGRLSVYVEQYYTHTARMMILIIEPVFIPRCRDYAPAWRQKLLDTILLKLASTTLVAPDHYT